jgi:hypothetical protein
MNIFFSGFVLRYKTISKLVALFLVVQMIFMPIAPALAEVLIESDVTINNEEPEQVNEQVSLEPSEPAPETIEEEVPSENSTETPPPPPIEIGGGASTPPRDITDNQTLSELGLTQEEMTLLSEGTILTHADLPEGTTTPSGLAFNFKIADTTFASKIDGERLSQVDMIARLIGLTTTKREIANFATTAIGQEMLEPTDRVSPVDPGTPQASENSTTTSQEGDTQNTTSSDSEETSDNDNTSAGDENSSDENTGGDMSVGGDQSSEESQSGESQNQSSGSILESTNPLQDTINEQAPQTIQEIEKPTLLDSEVAQSLVDTLAVEAKENVSYRIMQNGQDVTNKFSVSFTVGSIVANIIPNEDAAPGQYTFQFGFMNPINGELHQYQQNFLLGVVAFNTNRDVYTPGEEGVISIGVIDNQGVPTCFSADSVYPKLTITDPDGGTYQVPVLNTGNCQILDSTNTEPDYMATFQFTTEGIYTVEVVADTGSGELSMVREIRVDANAPFSVERIAATRLYPVGWSPMNTLINIHDSFSGKIVERLPQGFDIQNVVVSLSGTGSIGTATYIDDNLGRRIVINNVDAQPGDVITFTYEYDSPDISPEFYIIGPMEFMSDDGTVILEARNWQIANDNPVEVPDANLLGWWRADKDVYSDAAATVPSTSCPTATAVDPCSGTAAYRVYNWKDSSVQVHHGVQSNSSFMPVFRDGTTTQAINFKPVLEFNGSDDYMSVGQLWPTTTDGTVFMVGKSDTTTGGYNEFLAGSSGDDPAFGTNGRQPMAYRVGTPTLARATTQVTSNISYLHGYDFTAGTDGGVNVRLNGENNANFTWDPTAFNTGSNMLGGDSTAEGWDGPYCRGNLI